MKTYRFEAFVKQTPVQIAEEKRLVKASNLHTAFARAAKVMKENNNYRHHAKQWSVRLTQLG